MHSHPQRDFLFVKDVEAHDQPIQEARQDQTPPGSHVPELGRERVRLGQGRGAKERDQGLAFSAEAGLVVEELLEAGDDVVVVGPLGQVLVVE